MSGGMVTLGTIDLSQLLAAIDRDAIHERVMRVASLARAEWLRLADRRLNLTASDYKQGLQDVEDTGQGARIQLVGVLPNMLERGWPSTDLRTTLLGNSKGKIGKKGYTYRTIFYRRFFSGPRALAYMTDDAFEHYRVRQKAVQKLARRLVGTREVGEGPARRRVWGGKLGAGGRLGASTVGAQRARPRHATDLYAAMYRFEQATKGRSQNSYGAFRTISTNPKSRRQDSGGQNWVHPGIRARRIAPDVLLYIRLVVVPMVFGLDVGDPT